MMIYRVTGVRLLFFFFFQAEDGIRDTSVTGVQTCALPILADWTATFARHGGKGEHVMEGINSRMDGLQAAILNVKLPHLAAWTTARRRIARSEERRVGKEWRSR